MDFSTLNRIATAILITCVAVATAWLCGSWTIPYAPPPRPAFDIPEKTDGDALPRPISVAHGAILATRICSTCHELLPDGHDAVGPALAGVIGRGVASRAGYSYSAALSAHRGETWDDARLGEWLSNPFAFAPGTRMSLSGVPDPNDRADIIAWLKTLHPAPTP